MKIRNILAALFVLVLLSPGLFSPSGWGQEEDARNLLIEQKIVTIDLKPEYRDGIQWDLLQLYLQDRESTTGSFPLSDRARHRLDFRPMKKSVPAGQEQNVDFENVEQTRIDEFKFGEIWEDTRDLRRLKEDPHFGSLYLYQFKPVMDFLRKQGDARVLFSRKWITESGEQSMTSSQPESVVSTGRGRGAEAGENVWEGSRTTIKPEVMENNQIAFHLNSEVATFFYGDPALYPDSPTMQKGDKQMARIWRLYRLNTKGTVESGQTAIFEEIRDGAGVIIFITPYILEAHRKILRD